MEKRKGFIGNNFELAKKLEVSALSLRFFSNKTEKEYQDYFFKLSLNHFRVSFIIVTLLYALFGYIDYIGAHKYISEFHVIRYVIVIPSLLATLLISFFKIFKKIWQPLLILNFLLSGAGIIYMIVKIPDNMFYYAGLFLIFTAGFFFIRMRFLEASISGIVTILIYNFAIVIKGPLGFDEGYIVISNAFYISSMIIGIVGLYHQEVLQRLVFIDRKELIGVKKGIESINDNLEKTVNERTRVVLKRNRELKTEIITRKKIEDQLIIAKEKAEESNKLKNKFIRSISHEVRTPMNAIIGFINIIFSKLEIEEGEMNEFKQLIKKNSELLLKIIDNTLDISRIHSHSIYLNKKEIDIISICEDVFMQHKPNINSNVDFTFKAPETPLKKIYSDGDRIGQLIHIFIDNAIKFTYKGNIQLELVEEVKSKQYIIKVKDTGIGIDEHIQDEIFKPFNKSDDSKQGVGLGLFIAHSIAELLNIHIEMDSKKGVGSTFSIYIPILSKADKQNKVTLEANQRGKVLVIEDNQDNYLLVEELLKDKFDITWQNSGFKGIEYFNENPVDVVLLDIMMTGIDGIETCKRIRDKDSFVPIVMISAMTNHSIQEKAKKAGANLFVFKPIGLDLEEKISEFFN